MKIALRIAGIILLVWLVLSIAWFAWSRIAFSKYCDGMKPNEFSGFLVPRYYRNDDRYTYFVKFPDYLSLTGNLAVSARDEEAEVQAFLIWPSLFGREKYGLIIADQSGSYQIYTDQDGNPMDESFREITENHLSGISDMVKSAKRAWNK